MNSNLSLAVKAAIEAGKVIIDVYNSDDFEVQLKSDESPLTIADQRGNDCIVDYLKTTSIPILSEEGKAIDFNDRKDWDLFWLVDPLDGTKEFIKRNGEFTVNIALVENGYATQGVIYVPVTGELYIADGEKSYKAENVQEFNLENIQSKLMTLPLPQDKEKFIIVGSRSHMSEETLKYIETIDTKGKETEVLSKGSSLKICMVAEGKADVYPRLGPTMEWDTGAGHAIAKFAGFNLYNFETKEELSYNKENLLNPYFVVE